MIGNYRFFFSTSLGEWYNLFYNFSKKFISLFFFFCLFVALRDNNRSSEISWEAIAFFPSWFNIQPVFMADKKIIIHFYLLGIYFDCSVLLPYWLLNILNTSPESRWEKIMAWTRLVEVKVMRSVQIQDEFEDRATGIYVLNICWEKEK